MVKYLIKLILCLLLISLQMDLALARTVHHKKKKKGSPRSTKVLKSKKSKNGKKKHHHGTGPDLKKITTESNYTEEPKNGENPIDNNLKN